MFHRLINSPWVGAIGLIIISLGRAMTLVGFPPHWPQPFPWTWIFFVGFAFQAIYTALNKIRALEDARQPHLRLVFHPEGGAPYIETKQMGSNDQLRLFRVGIVNSGATTVKAEVQLYRLEPPQFGISHAHALRPMDAPVRTKEVEIHPSKEPRIFIEVVGQLIRQNDQSLKDIWVLFADGEVLLTPRLKTHFLTLAIHGMGADDDRKFVLETDKTTGWYVMRPSLFDYAVSSS